MTAHAPVTRRASPSKTSRSAETGTALDMPRDFFRDYGLTGPAVMKKVAERILQAEETLHAMVLDKRITESNYNARALWLRSHLGGLHEQFADLVVRAQRRIEEEYFYSTGKSKAGAKKRARR